MPETEPPDKEYTPEAFKAIARTVAVFYNTLLDNRVPVEQATLFTLKWIEATYGIAAGQRATDQGS